MVLAVKILSSKPDLPIEWFQEQFSEIFCRIKKAVYVEPVEG